MVPVGGAVVCSPSADTAALISRAYPGRASIAPLLDLFITLLSMGAEGYTRLLAEREALAPRFQQALAQCAAAHGEALLLSPRNSISFAMSLRTVAAPSRLGSMLFTRCVSGTRVVDSSSSSSSDSSGSSSSSSSSVKEVAGLRFEGYGASVDSYPCAYLTAACAIGIREQDITEFVARLSKALTEERRRSSSSSAATQIVAGDASTNTAVGDASTTTEVGDASTTTAVDNEAAVTAAASSVADTSDQTSSSSCASHTALQFEESDCASVEGDSANAGTAAAAAVISEQQQEQHNTH
jgi:O-phospho-L-seryl-tRNASec:L-selenocysteinyl-tRNA synthase